MEIHRQTCQSCGCREVNNILVREPGHPVTVYVRCAGCAELVAWYQLENYYHHGKGLESYLRSHGPQAAESGRTVLESFKQTKREALDGFARVLAALEAEGKPL